MGKFSFIFLVTIRATNNMLKSYSQDCVHAVITIKNTLIITIQMSEKNVPAAQTLSDFFVRDNPVSAEYICRYAIRQLKPIRLLLNDKGTIFQLHVI